jgi:hypothetical protein
MLQVTTGEATRGSEPSIRGGQVAEIQGSRELGGSRGRSPKVGCSKSRVAKPREDLSRPLFGTHVRRSRKSGIGESEYPSTKKSCHTESRSTIYRQDQNRPLGGTRVNGFRRVEVRGIGVSGGKKLPHIGIAIRDIPTGEPCGPQREIVEDRCYQIEVRDLESSVN